MNVIFNLQDAPHVSEEDYGDNIRLQGDLRIGSKVFVAVLNNQTHRVYKIESSTYLSPFSFLSTVCISIGLPNVPQRQ